jgi:hypothetical protein
MEAVLNIKRGIHNVALAASKLNELLNDKLSDGASLEDVPTVIGYMKQINDLANQFPNTIKALNVAEENLLYEQENVAGRGGLKFSSGYYKKDKTVRPAQQTNVWVDKDERLLAPLNHLPNCNGAIYNLQLSMYAFAVEYILGLTIKGIWLCHIDSDFELNEYGMPKRFSDGLYHIKENPVETTKFFTMNYLRDDISKVLKDRELQIKASGVQTQFKLAI